MSANERFVVVNVDDLGLHPAVRRAVESLAGSVTSATILSNGMDVENIRPVEGVGFGVHLNILRGRPVSAVSRVPSLIDGEGIFWRDYTLLYRKYLLGKINLREVELEWEAQIGRVRDLGFEITHLDSEKHIHAWPKLMTIACNLAKRHGIKWVRRPHQHLSGKDFLSVKLLLLSVWAKFQKPTPGIYWPDSVWGINNQGTNLDFKRLSAYLSAYPKSRVVELCCHPGIADEHDAPIDASFGKMGIPACWKAEAAELGGPALAIALESVGATAANYGTIPL